MNRTALTVILALLSIVLLVPITYAQPILQRGGETAPGLGAQKDTQLTLIECIRGIPSAGVPAGSCSAEHIFILANNIIRWVVGVAGALALFMYVMGGLWMIFSAGSASRISRGKDILIGTTIALVFILTSWLIVSFVLQGLGTTEEFTIATLQCNESGDCTGGKICHNKQCVDRCYVEKTLTEKDPNKQWSCKAPESCGTATNYFPLASVADCENAPNCAPGLCANSAQVCCF
ncbi:MAG: hypothetical protein HY422_02545 [Candidatus Komeilibacteria bacterium]|nr:hypothetical protein [Candidatus Komeilibacteria bacterium]